MPHTILIVEDQASVRAMLRAAVWRKEPGHLINSPYFKQPERGMSAIGG